MTLEHHGGDYDVAASAAAKSMRNRLERLFTKGRGSAAAALEKLTTDQPADFVMHSSTLRFFPEAISGRRQIRTHFDTVLPQNLTTHPHALNQLGDVAGIPRRYVQKRLESDWGTELVAHMLNRTYEQQDSRHLLRVVNSQVRGFLSDKYKRMDSAPLLDSFIKATTELGAIPVESQSLDTKFYLKMMLPMVFEPVDHEVMAFGIKIQSSDYGDGAYSISALLLRLWCTNYAQCENALRKVHLGARLGEDLALSQETYDLDTKALASATHDVVYGTLSPDKVHEKLEIIKTAHEKKIDPKELMSMLKGSKLLKVEQEGVIEAFNTPDVEMLPPGNTMWRLSNAISLFAQKAEPNRALELEQLAGEVAGLVAS